MIKIQSENCSRRKVKKNNFRMISRNTNMIEIFYFFISSIVFTCFQLLSIEFLLRDQNFTLTDYPYANNIGNLAFVFMQFLRCFKRNLYNFQILKGRLARKKKSINVLIMINVKHK
jgi:hypothetical protein